MEKDYLKHIEFVNAYQDWPKAPFLPMFKRVLLDNGDEDYPNRIHGVLCSAYSLSVVKNVNLWVLPESLEMFIKLDGWIYNSVAEMVADGWEVD